MVIVKISSQIFGTVKDAKAFVRSAFQCKKRWIKAGNTIIVKTVCPPGSEVDGVEVARIEIRK